MMGFFLFLLGLIVGVAGTFAVSFVITMLQAKILFDEQQKTELDMFKREHKVINDEDFNGGGIA